MDEVDVVRIYISDPSSYFRISAPQPGHNQTVKPSSRQVVTSS